MHSLKLSFIRENINKNFTRANMIKWKRWFITVQNIFIYSCLFNCHTEVHLLSLIQLFQCKYCEHKPGVKFYYKYTIGTTQHVCYSKCNPMITGDMKHYVSYSQHLLLTHIPMSCISSFIYQSKSDIPFYMHNFLTKAARHLLPSYISLSPILCLCIYLWTEIILCQCFSKKNDTLLKDEMLIWK